ncbi:hypothetical protein SNE40_007549 [Patella caerulea]|uniref:G-protein coupled receptors family 1 profile domain-containing protein n=1 Tax=Patella caerulea TaxID=87958 RepID=A0AAN8JX27_PATCE
MKTKAWRHKSYSHYLCALAVFDSLTLINREIKLIHDMRQYADDPGLYDNFSDVGCSVYNFYRHICYLMSSWLVVAMATERFVAVYYPLRKAYFCTQTGAVIIIIALLMLLSYTQIFRFFMIGNIMGNCGAIDDYLNIYTSLHIYLYQFSLICGLPIGVIMICNGLVLHRIYRVKKLRAKEDRKFSRTSRSASKRHKATLMLIAISFFYVITLMPSIIISIIVHVAIVSKSPMSMVIYMKITPYKDLFALVSDLNYACNFFIYILSGKVFRSELKKLFATNNGYSTSTTKVREEANVLF